MSNTANQNGTGGTGPLIQLYEAVEAEDVELVKTIMSKYHINLNQCLESYELPVLHIAVGLNSTDIVQQLLEYNADPNFKASENGVTPLHLAVLYKNPEIIQILIRAGGDPRMKNEIDEMTCFDFCKDNPELSDLLEKLSLKEAKLPPQPLPLVTKSKSENVMNSTINENSSINQNPSPLESSVSASALTVVTNESQTFYSCQNSDEITNKNYSTYTLPFPKDTTKQFSNETDLGFSRTEIGISDQEDFIGKDLISINTLITPPQSFIADNSTITCDSDDSVISQRPRPPLTPKQLEVLKEAAALRGIPVLPNTLNVLSKFVDPKTRALNISPTKSANRTGGYSDELDFAIRDLNLIGQWKGHHVDFIQSLNIPNSKTRSYFNYLLLDPYIIKRANFSGNGLRTGVLYNGDKFETFLKSIFYIGKGSGTRPIQHLVDAKARYLTLKKKRLPDNLKLDKIVNIWEKGQGVIVFSTFTSIREIEANVNEAAMIDAMGLGCDHLTNLKKGSYLNSPGMTWTQKKKNQFGAFLLHKAFCLFAIEDHWKTFYPKDV